MEIAIILLLSIIILLLIILYVNMRYIIETIRFDNRTVKDIYTHLENQNLILDNINSNLKNIYGNLNKLSISSTSLSTKCNAILNDIDNMRHVIKKSVKAISASQSTNKENIEKCLKDKQKSNR